MTIGLAQSLQGIQNAETQFNKAAQNIAQGPSQGDDQVHLSSQAVALIQAKNDFSANVAALKVTDQMTQALLNAIG
jgi:hypothetical protein